MRKTLKPNLDIADALFSKTSTPSTVLYSLLINAKILRYLHLDKNLICYKLMVLGIFKQSYFSQFHFFKNVKTGQKGSSVPYGHKLTTLSKKIP